MQWHLHHIFFHYKWITKAGLGSRWWWDNLNSSFWWESGKVILRRAMWNERLCYRLSLGNKIYHNWPVSNSWDFLCLTQCGWNAQRPCYSRLHITWEIFWNTDSRTTESESVLTRSPGDSFWETLAFETLNMTPTCQYLPDGRKIASAERIVELI